MVYAAPATRRLQLRARSARRTSRQTLAALQAAAADPERNFTGTSAGRGEDGCAGDVRLYDWEPKGYGIVAAGAVHRAQRRHDLRPRWATKAGPAKRPGIVITNGSVQAAEQLYWYAAQTLAKAGYVVLTWDPQGQGQSDTFGEAPDAERGLPGPERRPPFYDGTEDALDFFLSTPDATVRAAPELQTGTSHAAKQDRRVAAGLNAAFNPLAQLLDPSRIGIAGHSYGAAGVSYIGQWDPRVKAIVAWDNLGAPSPATGGGRARRAAVPRGPRRAPPGAITKPALGHVGRLLPAAHAEHVATPTRWPSRAQSLEYSSAGVDTGELVIRGGTHYDFSFIPNPAFGATLRGADLIAWYTTAWFDKYVKGDPTADARLLTDRWRDDGARPPSTPTTTTTFLLLLPLAAGHRRLPRAQDLRAGCPGMAGDGGVPGTYDVLATSP